MEAIQNGFNSLQQFRPVAWEHIPDLGLYMDQVITFIGRAYQPVYGDDIKSYLSAPMINNYVKGKLIPRPSGKKYSREQIALLMMIVALKQVSSMDAIRRMLTLREGESAEALYGAFCDHFSRVLRDICAADRQKPRELGASLEYAILASGYHAGSLAALKAEADDENRP